MIKFSFYKTSAQRHLDSLASHVGSIASSIKLYIHVNNESPPSEIIRGVSSILKDDGLLRNANELRDRVDSLEKRFAELEEMPEEPIIEMVKPNKEVPGEEICVRADNAYYGRGEPQSYHKAFRLYKEAGEAGCGRAFGCLGRMYEAGQGIERNIQLAFDSFLLGAELKDGVSLFALGKYYEADIAPKELQPRGMKVAVDYYLKGKQYGSHDAVAKLAFMYENGVYFDTNKVKALNLYKLGARLGNALCKNWLGLHFYKDKDYTRAVRLFTEAKDLGSVRASNNLGLCYEQGLGVERNLDRALNLYIEAADKGYFPAMPNLAFVYLNRAKVTGRTDDYERAAKWFEIGLEKNEEMPEALVNIGYLYEKGLGVAKNYEKAFYYYKKAANLDYAKGCKRCGDLLYIEGKQLSSSKLDAVQYYIKASELGDMESYNVLGHLYLHGYEGMKSDFVEAFRCYSIAHKMGCVNATTNLGIMYLNGIHVKKNITLAHKLLMEAANKGNEKAQRYLIDNNIVSKTQFARKLMLTKKPQKEKTTSIINKDLEQDNPSTPYDDNVSNKEEVKSEHKKSITMEEAKSSRYESMQESNRSINNEKDASIDEESEEENKSLFEEEDYVYSEDNMPIGSPTIGAVRQMPRMDAIKEASKSHEDDEFDADFDAKDNEYDKKDEVADKEVKEEGKNLEENKNEEAKESAIKEVNPIEEILNEVELSDSEVNGSSNESNKTQDLQKVQKLKQNEEPQDGELYDNISNKEAKNEPLDESSDFIEFHDVNSFR